MPTLTLQPDAAAGQDLFLNKPSPTWNEGAHIFLWNDSRANSLVPLVRFVLTGIPAGAIINSATLTLTVTQVVLTTAATYTVRRILPANSGWVEGTKIDAVAGAGEPCWNALAANGAGGVTTAWAGSAGCGTQGVDYSASEMAAINVPAGGLTVGVAYGYALGLAEFANMVAANHGFLIRDLTVRNTLFAYASSDHPTAAYRPKLVIDYTEAGGATKQFMYYQRLRR